jgi:hypothetical protein
LHLDTSPSGSPTGSRSGKTGRNDQGPEFPVDLLAEAVLNATQAWDAAMRADEELQSRCVSNYSKVRFQVFNRIPRPKTYA